MLAYFSSSRNVFLNKFSFPASGNRFSVYLEQYSFIWRYFLLVEIPFLKNNLIPASETDFLTSGNILFLPFLGIPATDSPISPFNGNVFVNKCCILAKPLLALKSVSTSQNEGFCWKIVSTRGKITITGRNLWKIENNIVSTSQKISYPLAIISSFFENYFPLITIMAATSRKIALIKKLKDRKFFSTSWTKDLLRNAFPLYRKVASTLKNLKIS